MKGIARILFLLSVVCGFLAFAFLSELPLWKQYQNGDIKQFETMTGADVQDKMLVQGVIDLTDGCIAELEETSTTFGIPTSSKITMRYYAVYMYDDTCIIYATNDEKENKDLEVLASQVHNYYQGVQDADSGLHVDLEKLVPTKTISFDGETRILRDDVREIFREWYEDDEAFAKECETQYMIEHSNYSRFSWILYAGIGSAAGCVILLILAIVAFVKSRRNRSFAY